MRLTRWSQADAAASQKANDVAGQTAGEGGRQRRTVLGPATVGWAVDLDAMADEAARTEEAGGGAALTDGGRMLTSA